MKSTRGSTRLCAAQALLRQSRGAVPHEQAPGRQKTVIYAHGYEPDYSNIHAHWELANAHIGGDDWVESITFCPNRLNALLKGKDLYILIAEDNLQAVLHVSTKVPSSMRIRRYDLRVKPMKPVKPCDDDAYDDMTWACEVAAMRLLKKCKKETLVALCNDFGIPASGNTEKLAEGAAEQMHYETDDESDDDE